MRETELKPCGYCGCSAHLVKKKYKYRYECNSCYVETQWYRDALCAEDAWNKLADANAAKTAVHRYKYDVCGYTGEVILTGHHSHEDIVLKIASDLNYFDYEEVADDE